MKKCILPPKPKPTTTSAKKDEKDKLNENPVNGNNTGFIDFAPYQSDLWPQYSSSMKMGWNTDKVKEYNKLMGDEKIEVQIKNFYPFNEVRKKSRKEKDKELLNEIKWNPHVLESKSSEYKNDKEFMLEAVAANWQSLQYASKKLRKDKELVYEAVKQNWVAIQYADEKIKPDIEWK